MKKYLCSIMLLLLSIVTVYADEYRPAYLELQQRNSEDYVVLWKVPTRGLDKKSPLQLIFANDIKRLKPIRRTIVAGAFIERSIISRRGGLAGTAITIAGLTTISSEVLVRIHRLDSSTDVVRLTPSAPTFVVTSTPDGWDVAKTYLVFGAEHIWQGIDHLLLVACLIFIAGSWRRILLTITGFSIAHSITLTLAALALIQVPVPPVEAVIALSIVFLAREIVQPRRDTLTWRYPILVSATFGLLHGFGFAAALGDIGLPQTEIPAALLAFNIGVEVGQIAFVSVVMSIVWIAASLLKAMQHLFYWQNPQGAITHSVERFTWLEKPIAYAVGGITTFWMIERVMIFWG
ncbi:HupE/UreJ family protein [Moritella sp. F3]|uniref:HupE/UreJ family protein n=1 Tax=Moritella sp. F3 TaxID=2718882 RepID=UPI0018E13AB6|nr:HupE/UreJ family protein [Moritella sp. F3]GIC78741.1 membrane protein [Moritella sp. F1]GIC82656.1 membrane protein [Moritella sp. F3]